MHLAIPHASFGDYDAAWTAFDSVWEEEKANNIKCADRASRSLRHFCHTHSGEKSIYEFQPPPSGNIQVDDSTNDWEVPFAIDIGLPIPLVGRIDGLVKHRDTKDDWGYEFKTTARLTASFFEQCELNVQILTYGLVLQTLGTPIRGVMVEGMLTSATKVDNMIHLIPIQDHHLEDILLWLKYQGEMLLALEQRYLEDETNFPKNFSGCSAYHQFYIPTRLCEYADLCRMPDWRDGVELYAHRPEHKFFTAITTGASES